MRKTKIKGQTGSKLLVMLPLSRSVTMATMNSLKLWLQWITPAAAAGLTALQLLNVCQRVSFPLVSSEISSEHNFLFSFFLKPCNLVFVINKSINSSVTSLFFSKCDLIFTQVTSIDKHTVYNRIVFYFYLFYFPPPAQCKAVLLWLLLRSSPHFKRFETLWKCHITAVGVTSMGKKEKKTRVCESFVDFFW